MLRELMTLTVRPQRRKVDSVWLPRYSLYSGVAPAVQRRRIAIENAVSMSGTSSRQQATGSHLQAQFSSAF